MKKIRVALLMGGPSAEHEVSLATGKVVLNALDKSKYQVQPVRISKTGVWPIRPDQLKSDVAFIAMHGTYGEDGTVQGCLEAAKIPYTGSGVLASAIAMDKARSANLFSYHGLQTPSYVPVGRNCTRSDLVRIAGEIGLPCVVKPSNCGSSVGITIVRKRGDLVAAVALAHKHDRTALVQEYIDGDEVTCGVVEDPKTGLASALQPTQIIPKTGEFFDYHAKYTAGASEEVTPPRLSKAVIKEIQTIAVKAHEILGCRGMSRTDMIVSLKGIFVLETNTIPGMTETSLLPQAAAAVGIPFPKLLDRLIQSALRKK